MIAQALRNFPARAGKHLSLVIVNAHCQPRENGCSSAVHKQKFRVSREEAALSTWHWVSLGGASLLDVSRPSRLRTQSGVPTRNWKLETALSPTYKVHDLQMVAVLERGFWPLRARDDLAVEFDCDAVAFHAEPVSYTHLTL